VSRPGLVLAPSGEPTKPLRRKRKRAERGKGGKARTYPTFDPEKLTPEAAARITTVAARGGEGVQRRGSRGILAMIRAVWRYLREIE
jgi:hypothetical protein